jgi:hypothetical protein
VTDYGLDDRVSGVRILAGLRIFHFDTVSRPALGPTQPPIQWIPAALSLEVKRREREADHSHLVPKSKNKWSYTSIPQYVLMAWYLVKHRDNFTFIYIKIHFSSKY